MRIGAIAGMVGCLLLLSAFLAGCTGTPAKSSFTVDENGFLSIAAAPPTISEQVLFSNETYTKAKIVMQTGNGDVVTYLSTSPTPKAAIVYAPGAGERLAGHEERMVRFAAAGYAFSLSTPGAMAARHPGSRLTPGWTSMPSGTGTGPSITRRSAICLRRDRSSTTGSMSRFTRWDRVTGEGMQRLPQGPTGISPGMSASRHPTGESWTQLSSRDTPGIPSGSQHRLNPARTSERSPPARSGCSMQKAIQSSPSNPEGIYSAVRENQRPSSSSPGITGSIRMLMQRSLVNGRKFMAPGDE